MADIPGFTDLENYRYDSFTNSLTPKLIGYGANPTEDRTIPNAAPYSILLHEAPQLNVPSTTSITDITAATILEEVSKTTTPGNNQYRVNYDERGLGQTEFNANQKGHAISIKYHGEGAVNKVENLQSTLNQIQALNIINISADVTLNVATTTSDVLLLVDPSAARVNITLYGLASNAGNTIRTINVDDGITRIIRDGGDNIDDGVNDVTEFSMYSRGNNATLYASTKWQIKKLKATIKSGYIRRTDYTAVILGSVDIIVNGGDSPSLGYEIGELVNDTVATGRIIKILDNANGTGTITVYDCIGTGNFANGNVLTGLNTGATSNVNGNTKNVDNNFYHGTGLDNQHFNIALKISSDGTNSTYSFSPSQVYNDGVNSGGAQLVHVDLNNVRFDTGLSGAFYVDAAGQSRAWVNDWYHNMIFTRSV